MALFGELSDEISVFWSIPIPKEALRHLGNRYEAEEECFASFCG
jgi:hypothetical protein